MFTLFYSCELTFFVHLDHIIPNLFVKGPLENFETIMAGNKKIQNPKKITTEVQKNALSWLGIYKMQYLTDKGLKMLLEFS